MRKGNVKFKFVGSSDQKVQIGRGQHLEVSYTNCSVSQKVQIFGARSWVLRVAAFDF